MLFDTTVRGSNQGLWKFRKYKYKILQGKSGVPKLDAECKATYEYNIFNKTQKITSDFDKEVKKLINKKEDLS